MNNRSWAFAWGVMAVVAACAAGCAALPGQTSAVAFRPSMDHSEAAAWNPALEQIAATPVVTDATVMRGQTPGYGAQPSYQQQYPQQYQQQRSTPVPDGPYQQRMAANGVAGNAVVAAPKPGQGAYAPPPTQMYHAAPTQGEYYNPPGNSQPLPPPAGGPLVQQGDAFLPPSALPPEYVAPPATADLDVLVDETRTGRFMFGVGVNSDAGVTGQIVVDERNFDIARPPTSFEDILNGTAFRGGGQGFRLEAAPGSQVERYLVSYTQPYLLDTPVSLNVSGFYYTRGFFDWNETRLGGRLATGYRLTPDLSLTAGLRAEQVELMNPRDPTVPELAAAVGENELYSGQLTLTHDTRDIPFAPTEGHLLELSYEQAFGSFNYPRAEIDYRKYFLLRERPDGSGRHTLAYSFRYGFSGSDTPIFENFFAGGHSTLRGFDFRGASPVAGNADVIVGGEFRMLGSVEYFFPLNASDMLKGVVFCDFGTVEEQIEINPEDYRVAPGFGLRIFVPAMGPAPIALDFAVPIARENTDDIQNFSFFVGFGR